MEKTGTPVVIFHVDMVGQMSSTSPKSARDTKYSSLDLIDKGVFTCAAAKAAVVHTGDQLALVDVSVDIIPEFGL